MNKHAIVQQQLNEKTCFRQSFTSTNTAHPPKVSMAVLFQSSGGKIRARRPRFTRKSLSEQFSNTSALFLRNPEKIHHPFSSANTDFCSKSVFDGRFRAF